MDYNYLIALLRRREEEVKIFQEKAKIWGGDKCSVEKYENELNKIDDIIIQLVTIASVEEELERIK